MSIMSSWLFVHKLYQNNKKRKSNLCIVSLCEEKSTNHQWIPSQMASNAEIISRSWCHHVVWCSKRERVTNQISLICFLCSSESALFTCWISCSYLAGVTTAQLMLHLPAMNVIKGVQQILTQKQNVPNGDIHEYTLITLTPRMSVISWRWKWPEGPDRSN